MGYIYKITNQINQKVYIGQTINPIEVRMSKHYSKAKNEVGLTGIDRAIQLYGKENFLVEQIEECDNNNLNNRERYWINYYNSYKTGYNLTTGGQENISTMFSNEEIQQIIEAYKELKTTTEVAQQFNCSSHTISNILKVNHIPIIGPRGGNNPQNIIGKGKPFKEGDGVKPVKIIEFDLKFDSLKDCSQWLIDNNYTKTTNMEMVRKSLSRTLNKKRQSYCKLHFEFI